MMSQSNQNFGALVFPGQFPLTAPDLMVAGSPSNPSEGGIVDMDALATETTSEVQNLTQDLTNRLTELPGSNLDFGTPNTRGVGLMSYLSGTTEQLAGLPHRIDAEFEQDSRVTTSATSLIKQADGSFLISTQLIAVGGVVGLSWSWSQSGVVPVPTGG
jgi:hypothetical protein